MARTAVKVVEPGSLGRLVDEYLASCKARGLSPKTIETGYGWPLKKILLPFCETEGIDQVSRLTRPVLDRLSTSLMDGGGVTNRPLSRHTVHTYMRTVNVFLNWAKNAGEKVNAKAQLPRLPKKIIEILSREEIRALEDAGPSERDKLIVRLLGDTGMRVGELCALRVDDIVVRGRQQFLHVRGKGSRDRLAPLPPDLARRVTRFATRQRPADAPSDRLFVGLRRAPGGLYQPLTTSGVEQMLRGLGERANLGKRVHPHLLRHSYATYALQRGMNPILLADILGHTSLTMIQSVYSHLTPSDAYDAMVKMLVADD
jgi:integrase